MNLIINTHSISQHNGFFSLTDLHKASGNQDKHKPVLFLRNQQTQELISEIELENKVAYHTIKGNRSDGAKSGTYACEELVYAYAMWISAKFNLMVIRAFKALNTGAIPCLPKTTAHDRTPLIQACTRLSAGYMNISDVYKMVGNHFGYDDVVSIPAPLLPEAVAFVYELILTKSKGGMNDHLSINAQNLAWHTQFIYSWYKAIEEPFRMLSPKLSGEIHDHITHAAIFANHIGKHLGYNGMNPERLRNIDWSVGRYY